jgi:hypothetical protein
LFLSLFAPEIMTMLADSFLMIGHQFTNGSSSSEPIEISSPTDRRSD